MGTKDRLGRLTNRVKPVRRVVFSPEVIEVTNGDPDREAKCEAAKQRALAKGYTGHGISVIEIVKDYGNGNQTAH